MQLKIYILIFGCIFFYKVSAQTINKDTLKTVNVFVNKDSILKITVINSNVPYYIINNDKLNEISANDVGDALKYIPGTYLKDYGGIGGLKTISYRSLGASHTNVEVDGVILPTTQTAVVNLSGFDVFSVNQIEMTAGQVQNHFSTASSYTKANVLSITSNLFKIPKQQFNLKIMGLSTSINSYQNGVFYQQKLSDYWSVGVQGLAIYGSGQYPFSITNVDSVYTAVRNNSALKNYNIKGALTYCKNGLKLFLSGGYVDNYQQLPGAVVLYNPFNDQTLNKIKSNAKLVVQYQLNKYALGINVFGQQSFTTYRDNQFLNQQGFIENYYNNNSIGGGFIFNRFLSTPTQKLFLGSDVILSSLSGNQFSISPFRTSINSVLGISKWWWRFKVQTNLSHQLIKDVTPNNVKLISHFSPFVSLSYIPFKKHQFRLRTHYKNTYRLPSFNDLYYNFIGNNNLRAENIEGFNFGLTYAKTVKALKTETTIDVYQNYIKDKIVAIPTKNLFNWSMQNIGNVLARGIDINVLITYKTKKQELTLSSGQSFNSSIDVTNVNGITYGHQIPYTPKYSGNYTLTYGYLKNYITFTLIHSGSRYILNENTPYNLLKGFIDFGISLNRTFRFKNQKIYANLQMANVLNNNYQMIKSFPMPGRHFRLKIVYNFKK